MKDKNFSKILSLFDYFKKAYRINTVHHELYRPQIFLIIFRALLFLITAMAFIRIFDRMALLPALSEGKWFDIFWNEFMGLPMMSLIATLLIGLLGSTYVEGGLYHMYFKRINADTDNDHFNYGASRYFLRILLGNLLIILFWIIALIPYLLVGALTLFAGFTLIPVLVSVFMMTWKAAMVSEDLPLFDAIGRSFSFGKRHFLPASFLVILRGCLTTLAGSSSSGSGSGWNMSNQNTSSGLNNGTLDMPGDIPRFSGPVDSIDNVDWVSLVRIILMVAASVVTVIFIVAGLIQMVFDIFFGLTITIIYLEDWEVIQ